MTVIPDIKRDFQDYVDNLEPMVLAIRDGVSYHVAHAHQDQIGLSEHAPGGGDVKQGDVVWQFPVVESMLSSERLLGSTITDGTGTVWTVLGSNLLVWQSKWQAHCRALTVEAGLDTTITLYTATYTKNEEGEAIAAWAVVAEIAAGVQIETASVTADRGADETERTYRITLARELPVIPGADHKLVDSAGYTYRMLNYHASEQISQLPYLICRRLERR